MKSKLKHLCIGGILLASNDYGCAMNIRVSDMRLYGKPELWNQIIDKDRIIENQKREKEKDRRLIETQKREIEDLKEGNREFEKKIADLEALVQRLQAEHSKNPIESEISRANSYDILGDSNLTLNCEEINEAGADSEFLDGSISPIGEEGNFRTVPPTHPNSMMNIMLPPPSTERSVREKNPHLPHFSSSESGKLTVPLAPPPPLFSSGNTKSNIPLAPPPPLFSSENAKSNIPLAPPPPPLSGKKSRTQSGNLSNLAETKKGKDSQKLIESAWADQRESLRKSHEIEQTAAKIVNIYLKNRPAKIHSAILSYKEKVKNLEERLLDYETQRRNQGNQKNRPSKNQGNTEASDNSEEIFKTSDLSEIISEIFASLEDFEKSVNEKGTKSSSKKTENAAVGSGNDDAVSRKSDTPFFDISQRVNKLAIRYFNEVNREQSSSNLRQMGDFVIESVRIADSLSDLENLKNESKDSTDSADNFCELDKTVKFAFDILHLGQKISAELSGESVNLGESTNPPISHEQRLCLERSLEYIRNTYRGNNQLHNLLEMRDIINHNLSPIAIPDSPKHPLSTISKLPEDMKQMVDQIARLFIQALSDKDNSSYSQFGTLSMNMSGNKINPGDAQIRSSNGNSRGNCFRNFFDDDNLNGKFGDGIIELITADRNLFPHFDILLRDLKNKLKITRPKKILSEYSQQASTNPKNSKFLCLLKSTNGDILPLSHNAGTQLTRLKDRGREVVEHIAAIPAALQEIPSYLSKYYNLFGERSQTVSDCVNKIFKKNLVPKQLINGNFGFSTENNHIVVEMNEKAGKKNKNFSLTNDDIFRIIFSITLNCDLIAKSYLKSEPESPPKLFLSNENISVNEVAEITTNLCNALGRVRKSLEFVTLEDSFQTQELREVFQTETDNAQLESDIIQPLDGLIMEIQEKMKTMLRELHKKRDTEVPQMFSPRL